MSDTPALPQRRRFSRVRFNARAELQLGEEFLPCEVDDLSLKGALLELSAPRRIPAGATCALLLHLDDALATIRMEAELAHQEGDHLGLRCRSIDIDSLTHLRRLLELNLGDAELLQRELSALTRA